MKVIKTKIIGYCFGVKRAVNMADKFLKDDSNLYSLGQVVHNNKVLERLENKGLKYIEGEKGVNVLIRAHGISKEEEERQKRRGNNLIDGTCPIVKKNHKIVENLDKDIHLIIVGKSSHSEVKGLFRGHDKISIIRSKEELVNLNLDDKYALIAQTTEDPILVDEIKEEAEKRFKNFKYINTLCREPSARMDEIKNICTKVQAFIVVGSKHSSNTNVINNFIKDQGVSSFIIESKKDIPSSIFNLEVVGLTSGASASEQEILEIEEALIRKILT